MPSPVPAPIRTRMSFAERDPERYPLEADELGQALMTVLEGHAAEGRMVRPTGFAISDQMVEHYDLLPVIQSGHDVHRFVSSIAGQPGTEIVALAGVLGVRMGRMKESSPALVVFLEWTDGRWWNGLRMLDNKALREDWPTRVRRAEDGWPRPNGLGGWWTRSRVQNLRLRIHGPGQTGGVVH